MRRRLHGGLHYLRAFWLESVKQKPRRWRAAVEVQDDSHDRYLGAQSVFRRTLDAPASIIDNHSGSKKTTQAYDLHCRRLIDSDFLAENFAHNLHPAHFVVMRTFK